jgi:hypothetical protein
LNGEHHANTPHPTLTLGAVDNNKRDVTAASTGAVNYSEKRAVDLASLDENPGNQLVGRADINTPIFMPRKDEVYASLTISASPVMKKSAMVVSGTGV